LIPRSAVAGGHAVKTASMGIKPRGNGFSEYGCSLINDEERFEL